MQRDGCDGKDKLLEAINIYYGHLYTWANRYFWKKPKLVNTGSACHALMKHIIFLSPLVLCQRGVNCVAETSVYLMQAARAISCAAFMQSLQ